MPYEEATAMRDDDDAFLPMPLLRIISASRAIYATEPMIIARCRRLLDSLPPSEKSSPTASVGRHIIRHHRKDISHQLHAFAAAVSPLDFNA